VDVFLGHSVDPDYWYASTLYGYFTLWKYAWKSYESWQYNGIT